VGDEQSVEEESFSRGLLDCPHYTRPAEFEWSGAAPEATRVPDVLVSGNHAEIRRWRKRQALAKTLDRRPELLAGAAREWAPRFVNGSFATIYLAPYNYHRIHMPATGTLAGAWYVPGRLFSVNTVASRLVKGLFARNERLVLLFHGETGPFAVIFVGGVWCCSRAGIPGWWTGPGWRGAVGHPFAARGGMVRCGRGSRWAGSIKEGDHAEPVHPRLGGHDLHDPHPPPRTGPLTPTPTTPPRWGRGRRKHLRPKRHRPLLNRRPRD
jgi:hypothetical protein